MALKEQLLKEGNFLFRWRSYVPLCLIIIVLLVMPNFEYPLNSESLDDIWEIFCLCISFCGLFIRVITIGYVPEGTSGTNTHKQIAEVLNTTGMYSITRNPLYLGNFIIWFGISLFPRLWWFSLIVILIFWIYYERIIFAEEEFLRKRFGKQYLSWAEKTPVFIPKFKNRKKAERAFCFRKALKNEYKTVFAIIVTYNVLEILSDVFAEHKLEFDRMWFTLLVLSFIFYLTIRIIKKKTRLLNIERD